MPKEAPHQKQKSIILATVSNNVSNTNELLEEISSKKRECNKLLEAKPKHNLFVENKKPKEKEKEKNVHTTKDSYSSNITEVKAPLRFNKKIYICKPVQENLFKDIPEIRNEEVKTKENNVQFEIKEVLEILYLYNKRSILLNQDSLTSWSYNNNSCAISKILKTALDQINNLESNKNISFNSPFKLGYEQDLSIKISTDISSNVSIL